MGWETEGVISGTVIGTILADSGPLHSARTPFVILLWASDFADYEIALRDSTNTTDIAKQRLRSTGVPSSLQVIEIPLDVVQDQRLVVRALSVVTAQASIIW